MRKVFLIDSTSDYRTTRRIGGNPSGQRHLCRRGGHFSRRCQQQSGATSGSHLRPQLRHSGSLSFLKGSANPLSIRSAKSGRSKGVFYAI